MSTNHHTALPAGVSTTAVIETRLSDLDQAIVNTDANVSTVTSGHNAVAGEVATARGTEANLAARLAALDLARSNGDATEANTRVAADTSIRADFAAADASIRTAYAAADAALQTNITAEATSRAAADSQLQADLGVLAATASTSGGTATTTLTRSARAAAIASIGGDGTTITVTTTSAHGFVDGDYIAISGTTSYNTPAATSHSINVLSTTQFTFLRAIAAATETVGFARTAGVYVADATPFVAGQQLTITNDAGALHATTVVGTPAGGVVQLADPVPTTWTGANVASSGRVVSSTLEELRLARSAHAYGNGYLPKVLPETLRLLTRGVYDVEAYVPDGSDRSDDASAFNAAATAAAAANGVLRCQPGRAYTIKSQVTIPNGVKAVLLNGATITQHSAIGNQAAIVVNASNMIISQGTLIGDMTDIDGDGVYDDSLFSLQLRRAISIRGSNVVCDRLTVTNAVVGIEFLTIGDGAGNTVSRPVGGEVRACTLTNSVIRAGSAGTNFACMGIRIGGASGITVRETTVDGFGESISSGRVNTGTSGSPVYVRAEAITIVGNTLRDPDDNCLYVLGGTHEIAGNTCSGFRQAAVKALLTQSTIAHNAISATNGSNGITLMGMSSPDAGGWSGEAVRCHHNMISGVLNIGIGVYQDPSGGNLRDPNIHDNVISFTGGVAKYGVYLASPLATSGARITTNTVRGHARGVFVNAQRTTKLSTTLVNDEGTTSQTIEVVSSSGFVAGDSVEVELVTGEFHGTTIASIAGNTINLATGLSAPAEAGARLNRVGALTYLTAIVAAAATTWPVADSSGFAVGDAVTLTLDSGATHTATVSTVPDALTITVGTGPATQAGVGQRVTRSGATPTAVLLTATAASGATVLTLQAAQGFRVGDVLQIGLDTGTRHSGTVASIDTATQLTLTAALPSQASSGNAVFLASAVHHALVLAGNDTRDATLYGIYAVNCMDATLGENSVQHSAHTGILLENCRTGHVHNNFSGRTDQGKSQARAIHETGISGRNVYLFNEVAGATTQYANIATTSMILASGNNALALGGSAVDPNIMINIARAITNPAASFYGVQASISPSFAASSAVVVRGLVGDVLASPASGVTLSGANGVRGLHGIARNTGAGTIAAPTGVMGQVINSGAGIITAGYALMAAGSTNSGGGAITTAYGLYVAKQNAAGITTAYGVYQADAGDQNYFAGSVGIGSSNPTLSGGTTGLHIGGNTLRVGTARTPASATAAGNTGEICWDATHLYICVAANSWRRVAHAAW